MQTTTEPTTETIPSGRKVPPPLPSRGLKLSVTQTPEEKRKREEKNRVKRATAAKELYETEVTYVRSIMILTNGFMVPCKTEGILTKQEISEIFSNVAQLLAFHKDFLKQLKERIEAWTDETAIGDIVLSVTPYMKLYTAYSANYDKALSSIQAFSKKNPRFAEFLERCMQSTSFGGLPLNAYLIMPIQRIPRYRMLLEVLVGSTPEEHSDYKQLSEALGVVRDVANYINTHIAKEDNTRNLIRIQNLVPKQQVLSPSRKFIMEASFPTNYFVQLKKGAKKDGKAGKAAAREKERRDSDRAEDELWESQEKREKKRTSLSSPSLRALESDSAFTQANLYLFDDVLVLQSVKDKHKSASLHLTTTWVKTQPDYGCVIELVTLEMTFIVVTGNEEEQKEWVEALTLASNNLTALCCEDRDLREQFVLRRRNGVWRPVPAQAAKGEDDENDDDDDDDPDFDNGGSKKPKKKFAKGGLLVMSQGTNSPILSPRARKATLTRNISTSSILAQMKENAASS